MKKKKNTWLGGHNWTKQKECKEKVYKTIVWKTKTILKKPLWRVCNAVKLQLIEKPMIAT